jgi:hypothetical protein
MQLVQRDTAGHPAPDFRIFVMDGDGEQFRGYASNHMNADQIIRIRIHGEQRGALQPIGDDDAHARLWIMREMRDARGGEARRHSRADLRLRIVE